MNERIPEHIVLQDRKSKLFYQAPDTWTGDVNAAKDFSKVLDASNFASENNMRHIDAVIIFHDRKYDVHVTLR